MKALKPICFALIVALAFTLGCFVGKTQTIRQAELISVDDHEYYISFGDEIHTYTFE